MAVQKWVGSYIPTGLDCNTGHNIAHAMALLLEGHHTRAVAPVYYYTCAGSALNVPYGEYVKSYRTAHAVPLGGLWVPHALAAWVIGAYHAFAQALPDWWWLELVKAVDYLLQVRQSKQRRRVVR